MITRFLPLAAVLLFFGIGFVWRAWLQYRRHGRAGIILFHSHRTDQFFRDALFMSLLAATSLQAIFAAFVPSFVYANQILVWPHPAVATVGGVTLLAAGMLFMVIAQLHLGASWRIGIEEDARPGLVVKGLYSVSRNPIFLGMFIVLAGLVVLMPTWISLAVLVGSILCVRSQVLEEEAYLSAAYGKKYLRYARMVGRFVPGMGRLVCPVAVHAVRSAN